jgi:hypothetical protein
MEVQRDGLVTGYGHCHPRSRDRGLTHFGRNWDKRPGASAMDTCGMEIGDLVTHNGETYVLRGLDPMSVPDRRAVLEHVPTGDCCHVPFAEISPAEDEN